MTVIYLYSRKMQRKEDLSLFKLLNKKKKEEKTQCCGFIKEINSKWKQPRNNINVPLESNEATLHKGGEKHSENGSVWSTIRRNPALLVKCTFTNQAGSNQRDEMLVSPALSATNFEFTGSFGQAWTTWLFFLLKDVFNLLMHLRLMQI